MQLPSGTLYMGWDEDEEGTLIVLTLARRNHLYMLAEWWLELPA